MKDPKDVIYPLIFTFIEGFPLFCLCCLRVANVGAESGRASRGNLNIVDGGRVALRF